MIKRAVILVAGSGTRLKPLTNTMPKCLTEINGKPILVNALELLKKNGIKEVVLVVGHFKDKIIEMVDKNFKNMKPIYVHNDIYYKTNNIYSLWLAREYLKEDFILLEGDIFFEEALVKRILNEKKDTFALLNTHQPWMDGAVVTLSDKKVTSIYSKTEQGKGFGFTGAYKTLNIYKFSGKFMKEFYLPRLDQFIKNNEVNTYYETVLKYLIIENPGLNVYGLIIDDVKWYEVDTVEDLEKAEQLFSNK